METASLVAVSSLTSLRKAMEIHANNIANMGTNGYQTEQAIFKEFLIKNKENPDVSYVHPQGSWRDLTLGGLERTGNTLDMAISTNGYFAIQTPQGIAYTRNGNFQLNPDGVLVNSQGFPVDNNGGTITIDSEFTDITIAEDGTISARQGDIGQIQTYVFANPQRLNKYGHNLLLAGNEQPEPAENQIIKQGFLERSNVKGIVEMTNLMEISRRYQSVQKMLSMEGERMKDTIRKLTDMRK